MAQRKIVFGDGRVFDPDPNVASPTVPDDPEPRTIELSDDSAREQELLLLTEMYILSLLGVGEAIGMDEAFLTSILDDIEALLFEYGFNIGRSIPLDGHGYGWGD